MEVKELKEEIDLTIKFLLEKTRQEKINPDLVKATTELINSRIELIKVSTE